jgi:excisionase family DNA binding protein
MSDQVTPDAPPAGWRLLTTREVAAELRVSTDTVLELVARGTLSPIRLTPKGRFRFRRDDVNALIEGR